MLAVFPPSTQLLVLVLLLFPLLRLPVCGPAFPDEPGAIKNKPKMRTQKHRSGNIPDEACTCPSPPPDDPCMAMSKRSLGSNRHRAWAERVLASPADLPREVGGRGGKL